MKTSLSNYYLPHTTISEPVPPACLTFLLPPFPVAGLARCRSPFIYRLDGQPTPSRHALQRDTPLACQQRRLRVFLLLSLPTSSTHLSNSPIPLPQLRRAFYTQLRRADRAKAPGVAARCKRRRRDYQDQERAAEPEGASGREPTRVAASPMRGRRGGVSSTGG